MNKKFKEKLKNKISKQTVFGFILGAIIFGTIGVSAASLLYSKDVTYDNSSSGLSATTVQDALDELYAKAKSAPSCDSNGNCTVECPSGTMYATTSDGYKCTKSVKEFLKSKVVTSGSGLYTDSVESGRYAYRGQDPNNYITFNSETWRIISVESDGTLKIIRKDSVGSYAWDASGARTADYCNSSYYGCNIWGSSSTMLNSSGANVTSMPRTVSSATTYALPTIESTLNQYLNGTYYNSLSSTAQSQIASHVFNVGLLGDSSSQSTAKDVSQESRYKWKGKIALANVSDCVRASTNISCSGAHAMHISSSCYDNSSSYNWLINSTTDKWWTLSPSSVTTSDYSYVWYASGGSIDLSYAYYAYGVRPVLYLRSDITLSGSGSSSDHYTIN